MYDACDALTKDEAGELLETLRTTTPVPVHPHNDAPGILEVTARTLARAGYRFEDFAESA
jgi:hypothetical protein